MPGILRTIARVANRHDPRPPGFREQPERIVLDVRDGVAPQRPSRRCASSSAPSPSSIAPNGSSSGRSSRPAIPLASTRSTSWPTCVGFDRRRWLTGFTNYRFAIPHFAGGSGRAIYNDVDQIYLRDPAELFDTDMGEHGFLSITAARHLGHAHRLRPHGRRCGRSTGRSGCAASASRRATRANGDLWAPLQRGMERARRRVRRRTLEGAALHDDPHAAVATVPASATSTSAIRSRTSGSTWNAPPTRRTIELFSAAASEHATIRHRWRGCGRRERRGARARSDAVQRAASRSSWPRRAPPACSTFNSRASGRDGRRRSSVAGER